MEAQGAHKPGWRPPGGAPAGLVGPCLGFWLIPDASSAPYFPEKFLVNFHRDWTLFGIVFLRNKKHAENRNWHWALN